MKSIVWLILGLMILVVFYLCFVQVAIVGQDGKVLWSTRIGLGKMMVFEYLHSVEQVQVLEFYQVNWQGEISLKETRFSSHGAGLPMAEGRFRVEDGVFVVDELHRALPQIVIRVAHAPGQVIRVGKHEVVLLQIAEPGERIVVRAGLPNAFSRGVR